MEKVYGANANANARQCLKIQPRAQCYKTLELARVLVPGKPFQPSPLFVSKAGA